MLFLKELESPTFLTTVHSFAIYINYLNCLPPIWRPRIYSCFPHFARAPQFWFQHFQNRPKARNLAPILKVSLHFF